MAENRNNFTTSSENYPYRILRESVDGLGADTVSQKDRQTNRHDIHIKRSFLSCKEKPNTALTFTSCSNEMCRSQETS
jgi:hypothetical protein